MANKLVRYRPVHFWNFEIRLRNAISVISTNRERWRLLIDRFWARRPGSSLYGGIFRSIFLFSKFCLKKLLQLRASLMVKSGSGVIFFDQFFLCYKFCLKKILWVPGQPRVCHSALYWFVLAFSFTALYHDVTITFKENHRRNWMNCQTKDPENRLKLS